MSAVSSSLRESAVPLTESLALWAVCQEQPGSAPRAHTGGTLCSQALRESSGRLLLCTERGKARTWLSSSWLKFGLKTLLLSTPLVEITMSFTGPSVPSSFLKSKPWLWPSLALLSATQFCTLWIYCLVPFVIWFPFSQGNFVRSVTCIFLTAGGCHRVPALYPW